MTEHDSWQRRKRWVRSGRAYLDRLDAPKRALARLIKEIDDLDVDDRDRILMARTAMSIRGPVLLLPGAVRIAQCAAEADIRRIWASYHPDVPIEQVPPLQYRVMRYHRPKRRRFRVRR